MPKPEEWKIKTSEEGAPVVDGTKVVFINPEGKEVPLDPPSMYAKIIELGNESKTHREKRQAAEDMLKVFDGVEDLGEYRKKADEAMAAVANYNDKDWMKVEKVNTLKKEMSDSYELKLENQKKAFEDVIGSKEQVIAQKDQQIHKLLVSNQFAVHPLFGGPKPRTKLTPDLAEAYFSKHFRLEEDAKTKELKLVAYHDPGSYDKMVYSVNNPGEVATFTEAMDQLWETYPGKDALTNATKSGSGGRGGEGDDDDLDSDDMASLKKAHAKAVQEGDMRQAIALKNRMHELRMKAVK